MPRLLCHLILFAFGLSGALASAAAERAALVIGNSAYQVGALSNPVNDATDVAAALRKLDFDVTLSNNLDREGMLDALDRFSQRIRPGGIAMVFYAGHGVQVDGRNWLLPVDNRRIDTQAKVRIHAVAADDILATLEGSQASLNMLVLDACRDNPLPAGARSASRGLGMVQAGTNTVVAYSTSPGSTAADGDGRNSPYTRALLAALQADQVEVPRLFNRTGAEVIRMTNRTQIPWVSNTGIDPPVVLASNTVVIQRPQQGAAEAGKGKLQITVSPSAAQVFVNGDPAGKGNQTLEWAVGEVVTVAATAPGYQAISEKVLVRANQVADVRLSLTALPQASAQTDSTQPNSTQRPGPASSPSPTASRSSIEPEMVRIPAGRFEQGSPSYEGGRAPDESPVHAVTIRAFSLGKHEVTRGEFRRFIEATGYRTDAERSTQVDGGDAQGCFAYKGGTDFGWKSGTSWRDPGFPQDDTHPAVCVSHNDAQAYTEWLRRETGKPYRLPTESELEYANRAGTTTPWPWGTYGNAGCNVANYYDATGKARFNFSWPSAICTDGHAFTAPVGSFRPNPFGLHDTAGNVWEWAQDCWNASYNGAPSDGRAWTSGDCARRVLRGGGWDYTPLGLRAARRVSVPAAGRGSGAGFRLAQD